MARTGHQQEPGSDGAPSNKNPVPRIGKEVATHSESSAINRTAKKADTKGQIFSDVSLEQLREVAPCPHMVAIMRRLFKEQQNDLANCMVSYTFDVTKPMVMML